MHQQTPYSQGQYGYQQQPNYHQQLLEASGGQPGGYGNNPNSSPSLMGTNSNSHMSGGMMNHHHGMSAHQQ